MKAQVTRSMIMRVNGCATHMLAVAIVIVAVAEIVRSGDQSANVTITTTQASKANQSTNPAQMSKFSGSENSNSTAQEDRERPERIIDQSIDPNIGKSKMNTTSQTAKLVNFGPDSMEAKVADATNQFGLGFINNLSGEQKDNVVISPVSLQNLLNMVLLGSGDNSTTQLELAKVLSYDSSEDFKANRLRPHEASHSVFESLLAATQSPKDASQSGKLDFTLANMVLTNKNKVALKSDYENDLKTYYDVNLEQFSKDRIRGGNVVESKSTTAPIKLHERVNQWVKNKTHNMIEKLAEESDLSSEELIMVLLNAAHFKGRWLHTFDPEATEELTFFNHGSEKDATKVKFMRREDRFGYAEFGASARRPSSSLTLNCSVLELPFSLNNGRELSMVILLPNKRDGLPELQANLNGSALNEIYRSLRRLMVRVELPKFSFEVSHDAKETLLKMGLTSVFGDNANLDRMFVSTEGNRTISSRVDKVIHKAKINVDESGAEAAAASMATVMLTLSLNPEPTPRFQANHPFLFIIRHNRSNMPLFMGRVSSL